MLWYLLFVNFLNNKIIWRPIRSVLSFFGVAIPCDHGISYTLISKVSEMLGFMSVSCHSEGQWSTRWSWSLQIKTCDHSLWVGLFYSQKTFCLCPKLSVVGSFCKWLISEVLLWMKHYGVAKESVLIESTGVIGHRIKKVLIDKLTSLVALHWQLILCDFLKKKKIAWKGWQDLYRIRSWNLAGCTWI